MFDLPLRPVLDEDRVTEPSAASAPPDDDRALLDAYSDAVTRVVDDVGPAVVRVATPPDAGTGRRGGSGSGVIVSPDGLVLTNSHVVQKARVLRLTASDGREVEATLL